MNAVPAALGLTSEEIARLLTAAGRAPSLRNSQPWRFRLESDLIELWADPQRRLPVADPTGREQRLACGAALNNLRLALHGHGIRPMVTIQPDPQVSDLLAVVRYGGRKPPTPTQLRLLAAIPVRHTNRRPFADERVDTRELAALRRAAIEEGAWLHIVDRNEERQALYRIATRAYTAQQADPSFQAEFARWTAVPPGTRETASPPITTNGARRRMNAGSGATSPAEHTPTPSTRWDSSMNPPSPCSRPPFSATRPTSAAARPCNASS